jgi:hypothetical protein
MDRSTLAILKTVYRTVSVLFKMHHPEIRTGWLHNSVIKGFEFKSFTSCCLVDSFRDIVDLCRGQWANGRQHGKGTSLLGNGSKYIGYWFRGKCSGPGQSVDPQGQSLLQACCDCFQKRADSKATCNQNRLSMKAEILQEIATMDTGKTVKNAAKDA